MENKNCFIRPVKTKMRGKHMRSKKTIKIIVKQLQEKYTIFYKDE